VTFAGRHAVAVAGVTLLAALLRFGTLDRQSFWSDEAMTVLLVRMDLREMLETIGRTESTPPLYYLVAWAWTSIFGSGEIGLRSLSALAGTLTVPTAYVAGSWLATRRVGLGAAGLAAVSPTLVWYSQEARAYSLAVLLTGLSFAAFVGATGRPRRTTLAFWVAASTLAVATHYFAAFVILVQAAWLLTARRDRAALLAVAATAVMSASLLPLAVAQRGNGFAEYVGEAGGPLAERIVVLGKQLLVGPALPAERAVALAVALVLVVAAVSLVRLPRADRRRRAALVAGTVGGGSVLLPLAIALVGLDYVTTRNVLVGFVPLVVAASVALAAIPGRLAAGTTLGLAVLLAGITATVAADSRYHRTDWRGLARELGRAEGGRAIVVVPDHLGWYARVPLQIYLPEAHAVDRGLTDVPEQFARVSRRPQDRAGQRQLAVRELALVAVGWETPAPPATVTERFRTITERSRNGLVVVRLRHPRELVLDTASLAIPRSVVLLEPARRP